LETEQIRDTIEDVRKVRSPEWFQYVASCYTAPGYGKAHALPGGLEGVVQLLEERMKKEDQIISLLTMPSHLIKVSVQNGETAENELDEILGK
jgi:hypothetical protein